MQRGFTLIELMIAVVVVAILAGVAIPSYQDGIRSSRRADGRNSLVAVQLAQEKWRANHVTYGTLTDLGMAATSADGYYTISVTNPTAAGYEAAATPVAGKSQQKDRCGTLSIRVSHANTEYLASGGNSSKCWGR